MPIPPQTLKNKLYTRIQPVLTYGAFACKQSREDLADTIVEIVRKRIESDRRGLNALIKAQGTEFDASASLEPPICTELVPYSQQITADVQRIRSVVLDAVKDFMQGAPRSRKKKKCTPLAVATTEIIEHNVGEHGYTVAYPRDNGVEHFTSVYRNAGIHDHGSYFNHKRDAEAMETGIAAIDFQFSIPQLARAIAEKASECVFPEEE